MKMNAHLRNKAARLFGCMIVLLAILTVVLFLHSIAPTPPASAAPTQHRHPNLGVSGVSYAPPVGCGPSSGYSCTSAGYTGTNASGWAWAYYGCPKFASGCPGTPHNCTLYVSYRLMLNGVKDPGWYDNANNWANQANSHHVPVDQTPAVGAIAQWNYGIGHVAYVEAVDSSGITLTMDDWSDASITPNWPNGYTAKIHIDNGSPAWPDNFLHFSGQSTASEPAFYAGKIVQWNGDTKTQKTSWLVSPDLKRYWIPDSSTYNCLTASGFPPAGPISSTLLDQLPDQSGQWATCGSRSLGINQFLFGGSYLRSSNGVYTLLLQRSDGNLVLYGPNSAAIWANSRSSDYLTLQGDNNLVTYSYGGGVTWSTGTANSRANILEVQDDGTLVLSAPGGVKIWESNHSGPTTTPPPGPVVTPRPTSPLPGPTVTPPPGPTITPTTPPPGPTVTPVPPKTYAEQEGHYGANTFTNPYNASGIGPKIPAAAWVQVLCKVYAPQIQSANPDGYWYLIASSPWNNAYYAVANTFMNGDPWNGPYTHNTDFNVPNC